MMINIPPSQVSRQRPIRKTAWDSGHEHVAKNKSLKAMSMAEMTELWGREISELKGSARQRIYKRIGEGRYLLNIDPADLVLNMKIKKLNAGKSKRYIDGAMFWGAKDNKKRVPDSANLYEDFDELCKSQKSLLETGLSILNVPELHYAEVIAGKFLSKGLGKNERVALVGFEQPDRLLSRMDRRGIGLDDAMRQEQLIYLYYRPDITHSISLSHNYLELFREVRRLAGEEVSRLVLLNVDALINCNSEHLVHTSLHQLIYAANHFELATLGLFVESGRAGALLEEGCRTILPSYFVLN